ncbi:MAG: hypothetical protein ACREX3_03515 [Gammaproteobacteria bacterium]
MSNTDIGAVHRSGRYRIHVTANGETAVREAELRYVDHPGNQVSVKKRKRIRLF